MMIDDIRIRLSWGLIAAACIHAVLLGALCLGARYGVEQRRPQQPQGATGDDLQLPRPHDRSIGNEELQKFAEPPAVNYRAQAELKQQCPGGTCPTPQRATVANRNPFNLAPGETLVPGSVRWSTPQPRQPNALPAMVTPIVRPAQAAQPQPPKKHYQVALFLDDSAQAATLRQWFERDPELLTLRQRSEFQVYTASNPLYQTRYASVVPIAQFPAVLVLDSTGGHIHAAGKSMIPGSSTELVRDIRAAYENYKQAKQGHIESTGALKSTGYSWDDAINPAMRLEDNCGPDGCPQPNQDPWRPGSRVVNLFDRVDEAKNPLQALIWANALDLATLAVFATAALLLVFVIARRS
jgi:hypothetical protein